MEKIVNRKNVNKRNLWKYIIRGNLPIPESIIPPKRPYYLWDRLDYTSYADENDYEGKLLDEIRNAVTRSLVGWRSGDGRVGVWISGGLDSSTLLYLTAEILGAENVRAYTLSFSDAENELEAAKRIADFCGVKLIAKKMTAKDHIDVCFDTVYDCRSPIDVATVCSFISKVCKEDGATKVFSALGLDELQGGYPAHVNASDADFHKVETDTLWTCQDNYVWMQLLPSRRYVELRFPYLDPFLIAFCRGLPRDQKCLGLETKVRIRDELHKKTLMPNANIEAGRIVGTKKGFIPCFAEWFSDGLDVWSDDNMPSGRPFSLSQKLYLKAVLRRDNGNLMKQKGVEHALQRRIRVATTGIFYQLLDEGKFQRW